MRPRKLSTQYIGIDSHIDAIRRELIHADLPRLREGGVRRPVLRAVGPTYYKGAESVRRTLDLRDAMQGLLDQHPDQIELATCSARWRKTAA